MPTAAAEYIEVRWRVTGSGEAWSAPARISPLGEVRVAELDRTKAYDFEARAVSNCGASSIWVPSNYTVPGAPPPTSVDTLTAQSLADGVHLGWTSIDIPAADVESSVERSADGTSGWAERARVRSTAYTDPETSGTTFYYRVRYVNFAEVYGTYSPIVSSSGVNVAGIGATASAAESDAAAALIQANAANAAITAIASDNILSAGEKPPVIRDVSVINSEQPGIDAQATAYAITTAKATYDSKVSTLNSYLAGLTTPTLWSTLTGDTTIDGPTFRTRFADVYTSRQTLLNAIYAAAKVKADAAQTTANTGVADAATAQGTANKATPANITNPFFANGSLGWSPDAGAGAGWYYETGSAGPIAYINTYAVHAGSSINPPNTSGASTTQISNSAIIPVAPGQMIAASVLVRSFSATGSALCRLTFYKQDGTLISSIDGNQVTSGLTVSRVAPYAAPALAFYAVFGCVVYSHTTGYWTFCAASWAYSPNSVDEVPDGSTYGRPLNSRLNAGRPTMDFGESIHNHKNLDYIDNGSTYGRVASPYLNAARPVMNFADTFHPNKNLDYVSDTGSYSRSPSFGAGGAIVVDNANFTATTDANGLVPGWSSGNSATLANFVTSVAPFTNKNCLHITAGATGSSFYAYGRKFKVEPGDKMLIRGWVFSESGMSARITLIYLNSLGSYVAELSAPGSGYSAWQQVTATGIVPAGVSQALIWLVNDNTGGGSSYFTDIYVTRAANLGTETRGILASQLNAPNSLTLNMGAVRSGTALTAYSTGSVTVNAFTYYMGTAQVPYSAVTAAVTGLTVGVLYYIYCHDSGGSGGSKTWYATASVNTLLTTYDDIVVAGQVTIPSSGSGGGGGGGACVTDNMLIHEDLEAGEAKPGQVFDCMDVPRRGSEKFCRRMLAVERSQVECVRITTENGAVLECSTSTPFDLPEGGVAFAPDMLGREVFTDWGVELVVDAAHIGVHGVSHIHLGGCSYAAGVDSLHRIYSHNLQYKP